MQMKHSTRNIRGKKQLYSVKETCLQHRLFCRDLQSFAAKVFDSKLHSGVGRIDEKTPLSRNNLMLSGTPYTISRPNDAYADLPVPNAMRKIHGERIVKGKRTHGQDMCLAEMEIKADSQG
jgi:hypothetical protein